MNNDFDPITREKALVVFLENVGHIHGIPLPQWAKDTVDFVTEEYAKLNLWRFGAYRRYDRVIILEDQAATGVQLVDTLLTLGDDYVADLLLLVHGRPGSLVGYRDHTHVDENTFQRLKKIYAANPNAFHLRMVFGLNCYGASLGSTWLQLGAQVVNGACGVNWLPEPSLSTFLQRWLQGDSFGTAFLAAHQRGLAWGRKIWPPDSVGNEHPRIAGSRQILFGRRDVDIESPV